MREETVRFESDPKPREFPLWFSATGLLMPAGWLIGFWSLVLHARIVCRAWPRAGHFERTGFVPSTIDPKALGPHAEVIQLWGVLLVYIVPLVLLMLGVSIFDKRLRQPPALIVVFFVSTALVALTLFLDPGGFVDWLAD